MPWRFDAPNGVLHVWGEPDADEAEALCASLRLAELPADPLCVALLELDLEDGVAVAHLVNAMRHLASERQIVLRDCPQMLAHTLYKVGDLRHIRLVDPRHEEAFGA